MLRDNSQIKNILVVDDDKLVQAVMKSMLKGMGCHVEVADDGVAALNLFNQEKFDLVFSDLDMPNMNGMELAQSIRQTEGNGRHTPIIGVSSSHLEDRFKNAKTAGMDQVFPKPIAAALLKQIVLGQEAAA